MSEQYQARLRFILKVLIWAVTSGQWLNILKFALWAIKTKAAWDEAMARMSITFYDKQVKDAIDEYKQKTGWNENFTTNIPGFEAYLKDGHGRPSDESEPKT